VVNAFALPGGWVYVTRGILAYFNSEDELVGVVGHEVGHIVARHGAEQLSRQALGSLGVALLENAPILVDVAGTGIQVLFLSFSRGQETESDRLGDEYSTRLGYDAHRMSVFFATLDQMSRDSGQRLPTFLSTHPDPGDRKDKVAALADQWQTQVDYQPRKQDPGDFLRRLDGLVFGDDPRQGYVARGYFYHPDLKFQFPVPNGWEVHNSPALVDIASPDGEAVMTFVVSRIQPAAAAADTFVARSGVTVTRREPARLNGHQAVAIESTVQGKQGPLRVISHFIAYDGGVYVFHGISKAPSWATHVGTFESVAGGFDRVTDRRVLDVQPVRLRVKKAPDSGDFETVIQAMGVIEGNFSEHALLNGRSLSDPVDKGTWIKIIDRQAGR